MGLLADFIGYKMAYDKEKRDAQRAIDAEELKNRRALLKDYEPFIREEQPTGQTQMAGLGIEPSLSKEATTQPIERIPTGQEIEEGKIPIQFRKREVQPYFVMSPTGEITKTEIPKTAKIIKEPPPVKTTLTPAEREQSKASAEIIPGAEAGRVTLALTAVNNVDTARNLLFPEGTSESFRSDIALKSKLPFIGAMPKSYEGQTVYRNLSNALAGKILIQTGVAARPEEVAAEYKKFYVTFLSDPRAAFEGLADLQKFYNDYVQLVKTKQISPIQKQTGNKLTGGVQRTPGKEQSQKKDPLGIR